MQLEAIEAVLSLEVGILLGLPTNSLKFPMNSVVGQVVEGLDVVQKIVSTRVVKDNTSNLYFQQLIQTALCEHSCPSNKNALSKLMELIQGYWQWQCKVGMLGLELLIRYTPNEIGIAQANN
ncbi:hypothetical protein SELMODRAFT_432381 [Selaginella moellendorffii]|uniref:Uncharacterized protein n=1 Tax=Selaginella moellendorffii TaxID=88036 RepID=D8TFU1_SELML|nr:hypothetical protein SELMODRAFT_432381 [Selaginella moellendorffii]